ncbi:hypothetical protein BV898_01339 [Hypsibius exemplaris]|uniref:Uncharacterized protein n=1 Tax=Hypsibius exemplaris TaxID=2072580 RepID=A0A1W0XB67_HYPEX|nr:hypothetical protein BV898_01339 [Hypsibius exemplaris]
MRFHLSSDANGSCSPLIEHVFNLYGIAGIVVIIYAVILHCTAGLGPLHFATISMGPKVTLGGSNPTTMEPIYDHVLGKLAPNYPALFRAYYSDQTALF